MKKKILSLFLVMIILIGCMPVIVHAKSVVISGNCGSGDDYLPWILWSDGSLEVYGSGYMNSATSPEWSNYDVSRVVIGDGVKSIADNAFKGQKNLTYIKLGNGITSIEKDAFIDCGYYNDESNWKDNVLYINDYLIKAKEDINGLYSIKNGTQCIADNAFEGCIDLTGVYIPNSVIAIGNSAFDWCHELTKLTIPNGVISIGSYAFSGCYSLTTINIPDSVTNIGLCAFSNTEYFDNEANWENDVLYIDNYLIKARENISGRYEIKDGTISIAGEAFAKCSHLTNILIPDSVISICNRAFSECSGLTTIAFPDSVISIDNNAFWGCGLTSIKIGKGVASIGHDAFAGCEITGIYITDLSAWCSIKFNNFWSGDASFKKAHKLYLNGDLITHLIIPDNVIKINDYAFISCTDIVNITIPNSVTEIGDFAFYDCSNLIEATIPNSIADISDYTFSHCSNLKSVTINNNVTSIGYGAFEYCGSLKDIYYSGSEEQWSNISISPYQNWNLFEANIHYNSTGPTTTNYISSQYPHLWLNANGITSTYLGIGQTYQSGIQAYPLTAYPTSGVTWHSTNPQVATVSQNGLITGIIEGNANIYITTADGITSDAMNIVVTDLSKFSKSITYTDKVNQIGYGSNYEWIIRNNNFLYWQAFVKNDTNYAKYVYQNAICAPLFDMSEMKNLYSGECSVERAKEILLGFAADTYDDTFKTVKKNMAYKIGKKLIDSFAGYLDNNISTEYADRLKALNEDYILTVFDNEGYDEAIKSIAGFIDKDNPQRAEEVIFGWLAWDKASECFTVLSKMIDMQNNTSKIVNEMLDIEVAAETGETYIDMLNCLEQTCISSNVRRAATEIKKEMKNTISQNVLTLGSKIVANKVQDKVIEKSFDNVFKAITGGNFFIKLGKDLGVFVSNELLHAKDFLKCSDNVRLTAYMSVAMTSHITDLHNKFLMENDIVKKEDYAKKLIEQYNLLIEARKIGEENYYQTYKYNPVNYLKIKELFGFQSADYEQWYSDTISWLNAAKNNPEQPKPTRLNPDYAVPAAELYSVSDKILLNSEIATPYTAEEFYALFADKGFADAVLYSLGTDSENPDWNIVTHEAVEQLDILTSENQNSISDISGISTLKNLQYLDLSNQRVHSISEDILQLEKLKSINLFNNGLTEYPAILNDISSIQSIVLSYNLLTEPPEIIDTIEVDLTGNLLNPNEYLSQRYLYCEMPIIYNSNANLYDMIKLKDIYGCEFEYNGDDLFIDGTSVSEYDFLNTDTETVTISVNNSDNPNAQLGIAIDISDTTEYTEESFAGAFPDENLRNSVLSALNIDGENIDYSQITPVTLAEINVIDVDGAADLKGIELLKGLNKLNATNSKFETIPRYLSVLSNLQTLSLRGSDISSLDGINSLKLLDNLDISECNNLTDISDIKNISNLETLYADGLGMSNILDIVQEMPTVRTLSVGGNCIENIECILDHSFNYLNIQGNYIDEEALKSECLPQLMSVCNKLSYFPQINSLVSDVAVSGNTATVNIKNDTGAIFENVTLITAHYRDGVFIGCDTQDIPLIKVDEILNVDMTLNDILQDDEIKCFVWNSLDSMVPISREYKK